MKPPGAGCARVISCLSFSVRTGDGELPKGGHFVLSAWGLKLEAKGGAVVYFDSPHVYHHSEPATHIGPEHAPRMACALFVSRRVRPWLYYVEFMG